MTQRLFFNGQKQGLEPCIICQETESETVATIVEDTKCAVCGWTDFQDQMIKCNGCVPEVHGETCSMIIETGNGADTQQISCAECQDRL